MVSWSLLGSVSKPVMSPTSSIFRVSARPRTMVSNMHRGWNHSVMSPSYVCAGDTRPIRSSPFRMLRFAHVRFLHCPQMSPCGVCLCEWNVFGVQTDERSLLARSAMYV